MSSCRSAIRASCSHPVPTKETRLWAPLFGKGIRRQDRHPRVVKLTLEGEILSELPIPPMDPDLAPGMMGQYCPCGSAVDEERFGGSGDIWVADGYGSSLVHRFDEHGTHRTTLTGEGEGGGRFLCPHAVFIDRRGDKSPKLYIADRENKRGPGIRPRGSLSADVWRNLPQQPERVRAMGRRAGGRRAVRTAGRARHSRQPDRLHLVPTRRPQEGQGWPERPGWPNALDGNGHVHAAHLPDPDRFNSPHSVAVDPDGNLYVSEWLIGGRYTKLVVDR